MTISPDPIRPLGGSEAGNLVKGNVLAMGSMLTWAAGFPAAELLLYSWDPLALIVVRLLLSVGMLIPLWMLLDGPRTLWQADWVRGLWIGGIGFGMGMYLLLVAQKLTDPVTVALIASTAPIFAATLEYMYRTRTLTRTFGAGVLASVVGGVVATSDLSLAEVGPGAGLACMAAILFSWGSFRTVRDFPRLTPVGRTAITFSGGFVFMAALSLITYMAGHDLRPTGSFGPEQLVWLSIYALGGMALSQVLFIAAVGRLGITLASMHINTAPFYVMLILLALGDNWNWPKALGAGIVGLGVIIAQRR